jgi:hypothetical protein
MTAEVVKGKKKSNSSAFQIFIGGLMALMFGSNISNSLKGDGLLMVVVYGALTIAGVALALRGIMELRKKDKPSS